VAVLVGTGVAVLAGVAVLVRVGVGSGVEAAQEHSMAMSKIMLPTVMI